MFLFLLIMIWTGSFLQRMTLKLLCKQWLPIFSVNSKSFQETKSSYGIKRNMFIKELSVKTWTKIDALIYDCQQTLILLETTFAWILYSRNSIFWEALWTVTRRIFMTLTSILMISSCFNCEILTSSKLYLSVK